MNWSKLFIRFGRLTLLLLMILQCWLLASFPAKYLNNSAWYAFFVFILPALGITWWWITSSEDKVRRLFYVWFSYSWFGLVPMVGIVFPLTADKLDSNQPFDSNILKLALGITPLLLLLLLNSGADPQFRKALTELSFVMTVDIFDGNELLHTVIDITNENVASRFSIPKGFVSALLSFACISFILSPIQMIGKLFLLYQDEKMCFRCVNGGLQVFLNAAILGLRLGLFLGYKWNTSLFIFKNIIVIVARTMICLPVIRDEQARRRNSQAQQPFTRPPPTAPPASQVTDNK